LLQEVLRSILESYYEPQFSDSSHGFRPNRGCHTALSEIQTWKGTKWFIEGDISKYFDTIDHEVLLGILSKSIHDNRFIRLVRNLLEAGYLEDWKYNKTVSGTPQGGVISPILANIYLSNFDSWVENTLIPQYTRGKKAKANPEYTKMTHEIKRNHDNGEYKAANALKVARREMPSINTRDESYRRLKYVRYADDFILSFTGTKSEAEEIKAEIGKYLKTELKLDLSEEKTLITHATTTAAKFLGYNVKVQMANDYISPNGKRGANGVVGLFVPSSVIDKKCAEYMKNGRTIHRNKLLNDDDFTIVQTYGQEYRGIVQYYKLAQNVSWFSRLNWITLVSQL
jgi:group II intron reverse transcriptase/maturase